MLSIIEKKDKEKPKKHIRYFDKESLISLARSFSITIPWSRYERDIMNYIIDYMECSIDNRDIDDYDKDEDEKDKAMSNLRLIVKLSEKKQYVKINESDESITFVDDIKDCSLFTTDFNETVSYYLHKVRDQFEKDKFVVSDISTIILDEPIKNLIQVEKRYLD